MCTSLPGRRGGAYPRRVPIDSHTIERLAGERTIELTTFGRRSGRPSRIEIWWFRFEGRFIVTGTPGRRDWLANVRATPAVIVHAAGTDLPGTATEVRDIADRRRFFDQTQTEVGWYRTQAGLDQLVSDAPMIAIIFD